MKTVHSFIQYAYLVMAAFFAYAAYAEFAEGKSRYWIFILFSIVAVGMFFFKRHFRKKFDQRS